MNGLFPDSQPPPPLAEQMRPKALDQVVGQAEALRLLEAFLEQGHTPHLVFWGPPGVGKTTLSRLLADLLEWESRSLNASSISVKDIRALAEEAKAQWTHFQRRTLVFIDEIHRLNKGQQDVLLPIIEAGSFTLAGSTTENPYFSLTHALRSRVQLVHLPALSVAELLAGLRRAAEALKCPVDEDALLWLAERAAGDLRAAYTALESAWLLASHEDRAVTLRDAAFCMHQTQVSGDRLGDNHYDLASAFQKSLRGSDVEAAIYYLARFLETGEDPRFISRRLLVTASEDVGNADPMALVIASHAAAAVERLGMPEARIALSQAVLYVARAPKSNAAISAVERAAAYIRQNPLAPIPAHLRDAHYAGAEELGHGKDYIYTHKRPEQSQVFLPSEVVGQTFAGPPEAPIPPTASIASAASSGPAGNGEVAIEAGPLLDLLAQEQSPQEWFAIDVEHCMAALGWTQTQIREAINLLVKQKKIEFKRHFRLKRSP